MHTLRQAATRRLEEAKEALNRTETPKPADLKPGIKTGDPKPSIKSGTQPGDPKPGANVHKISERNLSNNIFSSSKGLLDLFGDSGQNLALKSPTAASVKQVRWKDPNSP